MDIPKDLKYTKEHEWVRVEGDVVTIGITDFAQDQLSDIVYLELPDVGTKVEQTKSLGTIEAVKAVSDIFAPVSGEVIEVNEDAKSLPEVVNKEPYGSGWMVKIKLSNLEEVKGLLSPDEYEKLLGD